MIDEKKEVYTFLAVNIIEHFAVFDSCCATKSFVGNALVLHVSMMMS